LVHALCRPEVNIHKIYVLPEIHAVVISSLRPMNINYIDSTDTDFVHDIIDVLR